MGEDCGPWTAPGVGRGGTKVGKVTTGVGKATAEVEVTAGVGKLTVSCCLARCFPSRYPFLQIVGH